DLIGDEQRAVLAGELSQALQKPRLRQNNTHVGGDGFNNDGRDGFLVLPEEFFYGREIVVRCVESELRQRLRNAGTFRDTERRKTRASLRQKAVGVAMVAAFKFHQQIAAGETSR